jgi:hypothetical protein
MFDVGVREMLDNRDEPGSGSPHGVSPSIAREDALLGALLADRRRGGITACNGWCSFLH